jgi:ABC-2 type transport system ATP-binding protein
VKDCAVITVTDLSMHYGAVVALHKASFTVQPGEVVGLLGPNGAGKSTTMKILTTYLYPTAGVAMVGGESVLTNPLEVRKRIGYLPEVLPLYPDMEVRTYLDFVGRARGLSGALLRQRLDWAVSRCGLQPMYRKLVRELSKGYRQRVGLAQALIHDPQVVILDEPTSGLDPHQILEIRHLMRELAHDKTVLLSTHILQEVQAVADRIGMINAGRIVGDGTLQELQARTQRHEQVSLSVAGNRREIEIELKKLPEVQAVRCTQNGEEATQFEIDGTLGAHLSRQIGKLGQAKGWQIEALTPRPPSLEETFLALTEPQDQIASGST